MLTTWRRSKARWNRPFFIVIQLFLAFYCAAWIMASGAPPLFCADQPPVVKTEFGPVQGVQEGNLQVFRGIPYAAPPVGRLRFRPPAPPASWSKVRLAKEFSPACPQPTGGDITEDNNEVQSEDCLTLNVWTPHTDTKARPVMVFIHGGALVDGSARNSWYNGTVLAKRGDVVVVTMQYRLGFFGFLELKQIGGKEYAESGNDGLLDMIAALRWVRQNVAAFGGNPHDVTVFGESAGGVAVQALMDAPAARGLFERAIIESTAAGIYMPEENASRLAKQLMKIAGASTVEQLQKLTTQQLLQAELAMFSIRRTRSIGFVCDGLVLKESPMEAAVAGRAAKVPLLIGNNFDELRYWITIIHNPLDKKPEGILRKQLQPYFGDKASQVIETYKRDYYPSYADAMVHLLGEVIFRMPAIRFAEATSKFQPTYVYLLMYRSNSPTGYLCAHAMDLPFVFGVLNLPNAVQFAGTNANREELATQFQASWIAFARSGNPNNSSMPTWPKYDTKTRATMELNIASKVVNDPYGNERELWQKIPSMERTQLWTRHTESCRTISTMRAHELQIGRKPNDGCEASHLWASSASLRFGDSAQDQVQHTGQFREDARWPPRVCSESSFRVPVEVQRLKEQWHLSRFRLVPLPLCADT